MLLKGSLIDTEKLLLAQIQSDAVVAFENSKCSKRLVPHVPHVLMPLHFQSDSIKREIKLGLTVDMHAVKHASHGKLGESVGSAWRRRRRARWLAATYRAALLPLACLPEKATCAPRTLAASRAASSPSAGKVSLAASVACPVPSHATA